MKSRERVRSDKAPLKILEKFGGFRKERRIRSVAAAASLVGVIDIEKSASENVRGDMAAVSSKVQHSITVRASLGGSAAMMLRLR